VSPSKRPKHDPKSCPHCSRPGVGRRAVGRVYQLPDGFAVRRWSEPESNPVVSGLASKRDGFLVLWALKHQWASVVVTSRRTGEPKRVTLDPSSWGADDGSTVAGASDGSIGADFSGWIARRAR
jgi:hypothetical protein